MIIGRWLDLDLVSLRECACTGNTHLQLCINVASHLQEVFNCVILIKLNCKIVHLCGDHFSHCSWYSICCKRNCLSSVLTDVLRDRLLTYCLYWHIVCTDVLSVLTYCLYWRTVCADVLSVLRYCLYCGTVCADVLFVLMQVLSCVTCCRRS